MEILNVNLIPEQTSPVYHASVGDSNRVIGLNLYEGASSLVLAGTELLRLRYLRPDGEHGRAFVTNPGGSYVEIPIPAEALTKSGRVYCKFKIGDLGCKAFYIDVERGI